MSAPFFTGGLWVVWTGTAAIASTARKTCAVWAFTGEVNWVEIDVDKDAVNFDHLITTEQRVRAAMAHQ